jgi:hypothetical protein
MAGFSNQRQQLRNALLAAGLTPDAATQIASILGNSSQGMYHAGPVEVDSTPDDLRFVDPDKRTQRFPHLDFREGDPDHRPQRTANSEERQEKQPEPNVVPVIVPQQTDANFRVAPGSLTDIAGNGQAAQVNVNNVVAARPVAGLPIAMLDSQGNRLVGKAPRAQVGQNDGTARMDVQETGREVLWNLQLLNRSDYNVVTKIEYVTGKGLEVTYERIKAWDQQKKEVDTIPVEERPVVTDIIDDERGLRGRRRIIPVFESRGESHSYFNTYRIGTFEDDWPIGESKEITQVWPESGLKVDVWNYTHAIADTPGEKYVLFAARTESVVPPEPEDPEEEVPDATRLDDPQPKVTEGPVFDVNGELVEKEPDGVHEPEVEYVAIEIQNATECTAFNSLNGLTVDLLDGFAADAPSALSYETSDEGAEPCLKWRSWPVEVLTDVSLESNGLVFSRARLYVLAESPLDPVVIPVDQCPPYYPPGFEPDPPPEGGSGT